jgi:hypothetical protein
VNNFFLDSCNFVPVISSTALALAFFVQRPCTAMIAKIFGGAKPAILLHFVMIANFFGGAKPAILLEFVMIATNFGGAKPAILLQFVMIAKIVSATNSDCWHLRL